MKRILIVFILFSNSIFAQENNIGSTVFEKLSSRNLSNAQSLSELTKNIVQLTNSRKEQLQMLLLWTYQNISADSVRFLQNSNPLSIEESFNKRIALCEEFSNIMLEFCKIAKIPVVRIEGYVKKRDFRMEDKLEETNHAWNAVYLDSSWVLCDLFWSTNVLIMDDEYSYFRFKKKLNTHFFLSPPSNFIHTHLPCDPIFQLLNYPITVNTFTSFNDEVNLNYKRMPYCNYVDSINKLMKLGDKARSLKVAQNSYLYNPNNPNILIVEYFNYGVSIVNNKNSTKLELKKANNYFKTAQSLIEKSNKQEIKALNENCIQAIGIISKRLDSFK